MRRLMPATGAIAGRSCGSSKDPALRSAVQVSSGVLAGQDVAGPNAPTTPGRLLIVDDDIVVREVFADALRLEGHIVHTAATAAAALDEVATWSPDAILVDYRMGLINGLGFLYRLRAHESRAQTPVAVITGQVDVEGSLARECAGLGAAIYFKPLRLNDLRAIAWELLAKTTVNGTPLESAPLLATS